MTEDSVYDDMIPTTWNIVRLAPPRPIRVLTIRHQTQAIETLVGKARRGRCSHIFVYVSCHGWRTASEGAGIIPCDVPWRRRILSSRYQPESVPIDSSVRAPIHFLLTAHE
jgi:hypothetical protein